MNDTDLKHKPHRLEYDLHRRKMEPGCSVPCLRISLYGADSACLAR